MKDFSAIMLREKFELFPVNGEGTEDKPELEASGNRLEIKLGSKASESQTVYIIRSQNMHTCLRIGAHVAYHHFEHGDLPQSGRNRFEWRYIFKTVTEIYEEKWNPDIWAVIYKNGRPIHKGGKDYNPVLDIVEQCMAYEKTDYSGVSHILDSMLERAGKKFHVEYDSEAATKIEGNNAKAVISIIRRGPDQKEVLKMQVKRKQSRDIRLSPCLTSAAAIIEAYQLGFFVARVNEMMHHAKLTLAHKEAVQGDHASRRILRMEEAQEEFEEMYDVVYKPKSPDFEHFSKDVAKYFDELYAKEGKEREKMHGKGEVPYGQ